jgi:hypothetical protein
MREGPGCVLTNPRFTAVLVLTQAQIRSVDSDGHTEETGHTKLVIIELATERL